MPTPEFYELNLGNMNEGRVLEAVEDGIKKVVKNILDPNTDPDQKRKLVITIVFEPKDRYFVMTNAKVEPRLAAVPASTGSVHINPQNDTAYIRDIRQDELFAQTTEPATKTKQ